MHKLAFFIMAATWPLTFAYTQAPSPAAKPYGWNLTIDRVPKDLKVEDHIVYKTVGDQRLELTAFYPKAPKHEKAPLLVYIHGGGWGAGNRFVVTTSGGIDVVRALNEAGVVCVSIEYRLVAPGTTALESAADCKDAIHFMVKNAERFGIDPNRIATMGGSAGGHLSLVTALGEDKDYPCDPALAPFTGKVVAEVADFPLVSLVDPKMLVSSFFSKGMPIDRIIGGPIAEHHAAAEKLSPTLLLKPDSPAIMLVHGDKDQVLNVDNSISFAALCQQTGVPVELLVVKNALHGFAGENLDPPMSEVNRRTAEFLLNHLTPP